ncbi:MAG: pyruvate, phosphate dikinase/phosphoenolpyruvate synthase regulator [Desulfarculus sp.]|nr:pyruvate, phosphate dikinase/phosphoenolpyruvate synthase regulator [Desulfarculus sp.]
MAHPRKHLYAHIISDATGIAAERAARLALVQFHKRYEAVFVRHAFIKTTKQLAKIIDLAESQEGVVVYSIVHRSLREWLDKERPRRGIEMVDLVGPVMEQVGRRFHMKPDLDRKLLHRVLGDASLRLAESIDFTLRHDDGLGEDTIGNADIIILGVSRTSKTPTSLFISCNHSQKVANVPIILGVKPPTKIFQLQRPLMVGLTIAPEKLALIRRGRFKGTMLDGYCDLPTISAELAYAQQIFAKVKNIHIIDVTDRPIEEVASLIM